MTGNVGSPICPPKKNAASATRVSKVTINLLIADLASKDGIVRVKARQQLVVYGIVLTPKLACYGSNPMKQSVVSWRDRVSPVSPSCGSTSSRKVTIFNRHQSQIFNSINLSQRVTVFGGKVKACFGC